MNRNPLWVVALLFSASFIIVFSFGFTSEVINAKALLVLCIIPWSLIALYSIFKTQKNLNTTFEKMKDRDQYLDLLEDELELQTVLGRAYNRTKRNIEKIQAIGKKVLPEQNKTPNAPIVPKKIPVDQKKGK